MRAEVLLACQGDLPAFFGIRRLARRYQRFCGMLMFDRTRGSSRLLKKSSQPASPSVVSPASGVGVGIMVTHDPLHGSGRAALPHPALASGNNASRAQRMTLCCQTYPLQRTWRSLPALSPRRVLLGQVPLGQSPSLRPLRRRLPDFVRRLHRYYGTVRLPELVHRRRTSLDFPTRPAAPSAAGEPRASRFSCEVFPYVHGVCDRAGPWRISRYRCARWCLPLISTASASRSIPSLSRLNTRPARTPVNASTNPLRETPHDSGPLWVASLSACDSFIHNTSPVYPGAIGELKEGSQFYRRARKHFSYVNRFFRTLQEARILRKK